MSLTIALFCVLPAAAVVTWTVLWRRSRRARLWFAGIGPVAALAVLLLGWALLAAGGPGGSPSCYAAGCAAPDLADRIAAISTPGLVLAGNGVFALVTTVILTAVTLVTEAALLIRRRAAPR